MRRSIIVILSLLLFVGVFVGGVMAQDVEIDTPVDHDLFLSGNTVNINAPVEGDVFVAGGTVRINAEINGDLFVLGGQIFVSDVIEGKVLAAGGMISIEEDVGKMLVAGGTIDILSTAEVDKYARIYGGTVNNAGTVQELLQVRAGNFQNPGTAGEVDYQMAEVTRLGGLLRGFLRILQLLVTIGFLILGVVLIKLFPRQFSEVEGVLTKSAIKNTIVGFLLIILVAIVTVILAITVVGIPIAMILAFSFIISLLISGLFVSLALGTKIASLLNFKSSDMWLFILGFVILNLLYLIPLAGAIIQVITVSLGFGALFYTIRKNWSHMTCRQE